MGGEREREKEIKNRKRERGEMQESQFLGHIQNLFLLKDNL